MKEMDPVVLFWVAAEYLGPWLWAALALLALWALLLIVALRRAPLPGSWRGPLAVGLPVGLAAAVLLPPLTSSDWSLLNGALDWVALALAALAAGCAAALAAYPLFRLAR